MRVTNSEAIFVESSVGTIAEMTERTGVIKNTRLIVAAPTLLSALKGIVDSAEDDMEHMLDNHDPQDCTLCVARKVISEIEGQ